MARSGEVKPRRSSAYIDGKLQLATRHSYQERDGEGENQNETMYKQYFFSLKCNWSVYELGLNISQFITEHIFSFSLYVRYVRQKCKSVVHD